MEEEFDPLSLFSPNEVKIDDVNDLVYEYPTTSEETIPSSTNDEEVQSNDDDDEEQPLHILDLPALIRKPPYEVLITILKLFGPEEVLNFGPGSTQPDQSSPEDIFLQKSINQDIIQKALPWFNLHCPRFNTELKLSSIPNLSISLKQDKDYNAYLTRIISNDLHWITDDDQIQQIHKETSLRISENCGKSAQPEMIRRITLPNFKPIIYLKEPSLTDDNIGFKTWGASFILANRLINKQTHDGYLVNNVLELGSGTGLVGMICALLGFDTWLTDLNEIVPNLQDNVNLNNLDAKVKVDELNWCDPASFKNKFGKEFTFETIVVSDPIYSPQHPYWLVDMIETFTSSKSNARVLIQIPLRPKFEAERQLLWTLMDNRFKVIEEEIEPGFDDYGEMKFLFKLYIRK
ncbi:putative methyltransferase-domain-containing protein [Scheffersomyces coipomensis]|uniref:putative methyltransferase-domain-containing protein n=1 Tax=Scheffersomyces coipomensis TaxID=1788519 RepID=UPI00315D5707